MPIYQHILIVNNLLSTIYNPLFIIHNSLFTLLKVVKGVAIRLRCLRKNLP